MLAGGSVKTMFIFVVLACWVSVLTSHSAALWSLPGPNAASPTQPATILCYPRILHYTNITHVKNNAANSSLNIGGIAFPFTGELWRRVDGAAKLRVSPGGRRRA